MLRGAYISPDGYWSLTELLEFTLTLAVSALFVTASLVAYGEFASFENKLQFQAVFTDVSKLASTAVENGSSRAELQVPESQISCASGSLSLASGNLSATYPLQGAGCDFAYPLSRGMHDFVFSMGQRSLQLEVT
jgi:hypothetical protein